MTDFSPTNTSAPSPSTSSAGVSATARGLHHGRLDVPLSRSLSAEPASSPGTTSYERLPPLRTSQASGPRQSAVHSILNPSEEPTSAGAPVAARRIPNVTSQESFRSAQGHDSDQADLDEHKYHYLARGRHSESYYTERPSFSSVDSRAGRYEEDGYAYTVASEASKRGEPSWASRPHGTAPLDCQRSASSPYHTSTSFTPLESRSSVSSSQHDSRRRSSERSETHSGPSSAHEITPGSHYNLPFQTAPGQAEGTSTYHMMTLQTDQGPYSIPVDLQAASRVADEKRKRNAGASARFRARRKEKEMASTKEIDELKSQISSLSNEVEFYRRERDALAPVVYNSPERARYFPRPPSPRRQHAMPPRQQRQQQPHPTPTTPTDPYDASTNYQDEGERGSGGRITRRRLSRDVLQANVPSSPYPPTPGYSGGEPRQSFPPSAPPQSRDGPVSSRLNHPQQPPHDRTQSSHGAPYGSHGGGGWSSRPQ